MIIQRIPMPISAQGLALIKKFEGFSASVYQCPAGKSTIGYGHVLQVGESYPHGIDAEQADRLLRADLARIEAALQPIITCSLNSHQWDALLSLTYNIGVHAFAHSTLLRLLNAHQPNAAARQFPRWSYVNGESMPGLLKRRKAEMQWFNTVV